MKPVDLRVLIDQIGSSDEHERSTAGLEFLRRERDAEAIEELARVLRSGLPTARKSAAFLLGRMERTDCNIRALIEGLKDEEPKVRKNSVISLAGFGDASALDEVLKAIEKESVSWVRKSQLLALGRIGGNVAIEFLRKYSPSNEGEAEAVRKALDRCGTPKQNLEWKRGIELKDIVLDVPPGVEAVAGEELEERKFPPGIEIREGMLTLSAPASPHEILSRLRCVYRWRLSLGKLTKLPELLRNPEELIRLLQNSDTLAGLRSFLDGDSEILRYRFSLTGARVPKKALLQLLSAVRKGGEYNNMADSPSSYSFEINLHSHGVETELWLIPTFQPDDRFSYRGKEVGAGLNPVVAACLSRLVRKKEKRSTIIDPTCGSGVLLIERSMLGKTFKYIGIDVSSTAVKAARRNAGEARAAASFEIRRGDSAHADLWQPADEILANLPFGMRTASQDRNLPELYDGIAKNIFRFLNPGGRALIYTANRKLWEKSLRPDAMKEAGIRTMEPIRVKSGGLTLFAFRFTREP